MLNRLLFVSYSPPPPPHEEPHGGFFPCRRVPLVAVDALQKEIITLFPTVQSNYFSRLRDPIRNTKKYDKCHFLQRFIEQAKKEDTFSARCETATLKSEHSPKNVNSFITLCLHLL